MKSFLGSFTAVIAGAFSILGGLGSRPLYVEGIVAGGTIILAALAYRSAKRRKLGLREDTKLRRILEILALVVVVAPFVTIFVGPDALTRHAMSGLVVPVWSLAAYVWIVTRKPPERAPAVFSAGRS